MTLGDIRNMVAQQIGRAPSDLAVSAAQSEIAEALEAGLEMLADDQTNAITAQFPALYAYGILAHHAAIIRDEAAAAIWRATFEQQKRMVRASLFAETIAERPVYVRAPGATP